VRPDLPRRQFDYSGSQACRSLREEGIRVVLANSNPATIQTDVDTADVVYVEPLTPEFLEKILARERPQGILSGMGGQTALNLCSELAERGILQTYGVELLGTKLEAITAGENRERFASLMRSIGEPIPRSRAVSDVDGARAFVDEVGGFPVIVRAAYTLGGSGSGIATSLEELERIVGLGLVYSRIKQVLVEESVLGWKEFEYEVMRDSADNCITICNMENLDPMGYHTGESIVVAPAQTLSDTDHQTLRSAALRIIRALQVEGGCNIQFAVHPMSGEYRVIEVNPRVSRSSALASKATGYPIARIAAKIAIGLTLDEIPNPVTGRTLASFEPTLDYVVTKIPRWPFDKFPTVDARIGTSMKSTGEVMGIGRTLEESLLKAIRSLEVGKIGLEPEPWSDEALREELRVPTDKRLFAIAEAFRRGFAIEKVAGLTDWDPFFLGKIARLVALESRLGRRASRDDLVEAKRCGFSDAYLATLTRTTEASVRRRRPRTTYKMVDTCGGEFEARTPYYYSTFERQSEVPPSRDRKVLIVGGGPIRIGQGVEFDNCCVHGIQALREEGITALIANNNPETVSTDFDISDRLYFEPLLLEDILNIIDEERPEGVILQFGGQTSVNLAVPLQEALSRGRYRTKILGTPARSIDLAEDRRKFAALMRRLGIPQPRSASGFSFEEVRSIAFRIGYPVVVRPSYVLGGRGMEIVHGEEELEAFMAPALRISRDHPVLVDKYLDHATEIDVDLVSDGRDVFTAGIQEHIEEAGVHSGDATLVLPAQTLSAALADRIRRMSATICRALRVVGHLNLQLAVRDGTVYVLEANPRASRTVPYVSKAIGVPLAKVATKVMLGHSLRRLGLTREPVIRHVAVKASVFPFQRLPGVDTILGPEMRSTGEVMGIDRSLGRAYYKAMLAAGNALPIDGAVYMTVRDEDKPAIVAVARRFGELGLRIYATRGTAQSLRAHGIEATTAYRISENQSPDALGLMRRGEIRLVINTPTNSSGARRDGYMMRRLAVDLNIPFITTVRAAQAAVDAIAEARVGDLGVRSLHSYVRSARRATRL
jgi:carbamoyl-phosphate synthase large subunit